MARRDGFEPPTNGVTANPGSFRPRSNVSDYDDVLSIRDLEQLVESPLARYPAIQLSKGGAYFPPEVYSEDLKSGTSTFTGVPDVQKMAQMKLKGLIPTGDNPLGGASSILGGLTGKKGQPAAPGQQQNPVNQVLGLFGTKKKQ